MGDFLTFIWYAIINTDGDSGHRGIRTHTISRTGFLSDPRPPARIGPPRFFYILLEKNCQQQVFRVSSSVGVKFYLTKRRLSHEHREFRKRESNIR